MHLFPEVKTHVPPTVHHGIRLESDGGVGRASADNNPIVAESGATPDGRKLRLAFICP
jgi:hypothetical protein